MTHCRTQLGFGFLAVGLAFANPCSAQGFPFSQRGTTSQTVAFTDITVQYGRPVARGRVLFGDSALVRWGQVWHPGAASDVLRLDVMPERGAHMETPAIYFPIVLRDEATMRVHWGTMMLPVRIKAPYRPELPPSGG